MELLDNRSIVRARKMLQALPFNSRFYFDVKLEGLSAKNVFRKRQKYAVDQENWFNHSIDVEAAFRGLIRVGVLRREVDGQGLTEKIRLTPLGRKILEEDIDISRQKLKLMERVVLWFSIKWLWK